MNKKLILSSALSALLVMGYPLSAAFYGTAQDQNTSLDQTQTYGSSNTQFSSAAADFGQQIRGTLMSDIQHVDITTGQDGTVQLRGTVSNSDIKDAIVQTAKDTQGVKDVKDNIEVRSK